MNMFSLGIEIMGKLMDFKLNRNLIRLLALYNKQIN